ncbi:Short-chain dehydrogenase/reductase family oxidoreductase OS=Streptomyces glaucescens OX=1907 GN=SGLAU_05365 PE=3 SV=1 [Streptomyces glaucescens]
MAHQAAAVERTMEAFGRVDFLVDDAENPVFGPIAEPADLDIARRCSRPTVVSALGFARPGTPGQKDNGGAIVNIASRRGRVRLALSSAPTASARPR